MDGKLFLFLFLAGIVLFAPNLKGKYVTPSHWAPWMDISNERPSATADERYRYALRKTLDAVWVMKMRLIDSKDAHERLQSKDGQEIESLTKLLDNLHDYLDLIADAVSRKAINQELLPWERSDPIGQVSRKKLADAWIEIKEVVGRYKSKNATDDCETICKAADSILEEFPTRYKPIYELTMRVQSETHFLNATLTDLARRQITVFDDSYP